MSDDEGSVRLDRRAYVRAITGTTAALAGCGGSDPTSDETTETSPGNDTGTETDPPNRSDPPDETGEPDVVSFDGGGASAFADALDELRGIEGGTLRIAPGTHRLDASQAPSYKYPLDAYRVHFDGRHLDDVTITGPASEADDTATLVLGDPTRGFMLFADVGDVTVRDVTIRHDPWPQTQGSIREVSEDGRSVTIAVDDGYPTFDETPFAGGPDPTDTAASVFTADGDRIRNVDGGERGNFKTIANTESLGGRRYRLTFSDGVESGGLAVDRRLAVVARHGGAACFAFVDCSRPSVERVTVRSASEFCLWFVACERPAVTDCVVARSPESDRLVSVNADGVHCDNCSVGPRVEATRFERCGDDTVVVDNELLIVDGFESDRTVRVRGTFGSRVGAGDVLTAATPSLELVGELPPVAEVDERGGGVTTDPVNPETVTFERAVRDALSAGDLLTSPRIRNADTIVRNNEVRSIRARYVRIGGADGVVVADNDFVGTHSDGVEIEAVGNTAANTGFPKGWSTDATVRGNRIGQTGLVGVPSGVPRGIHVGVDAGEEATAPSASDRLHGPVVVADNEITDTAGPGVEVHDATDVTLRGNRILDPGRLSPVGRGRYGVGVRNVADARVTDTLVRVESDDVNGFGWRRETPSIATGGNRYVVAGESRPATIDPLNE